MALIAGKRPDGSSIAFNTEYVAALAASRVDPKQTEIMLIGEWEGYQATIVVAAPFEEVLTTLQRSGGFTR